MENIPQNLGPIIRKKKKAVGLIGLILVLLWPVAFRIHGNLVEKRVSAGVEKSNQEFQKFREQFGQPKLGDPRLNEFLKTQEAQKRGPGIFEIGLFYFVYYISPAGGFLFGLWGIFRDKGKWKILGALSIVGSLWIVYLILWQAAIYRMV